MPSLYLYVFSFPRRKKDCLITVFLKTKGGFVNQNACKLFYLYNCVHLHRTLVYRSNWMILGCYYTKRFHDSYYLQRCTHLCLKNKPSTKFKGAGTRKDKHTHCKSTLSVVLEEFHKVVVWLLKQYTSTANVTINTFLFWNSLPSCFASIRKEPHIFNFGF